MEGFTIFLSIVFIAFGVLQIILFFKVWGMTNNVKRVAAKIAPSQSDFMSQMRKYILLGQLEEAKTYLNEMFLSRLTDIIDKTDYYLYTDDFPAMMEELKKEFTSYYSQIGSELPPQFAGIATYDDVKDIFHK